MHAAHQGLRGCCHASQIPLIPAAAGVMAHAQVPLWRVALSCLPQGDTLSLGPSIGCPVNAGVQRFGTLTSSFLRDWLRPLLQLFHNPASPSSSPAPLLFHRHCPQTSPQEAPCTLFPISARSLTLHFLFQVPRSRTGD